MPLSYERPSPGGNRDLRDPGNIYERQRTGVDDKPIPGTDPRKPAPPAPGESDPLLDGEMDPFPSLTPLPSPPVDQFYSPNSSDLPLTLQGSKGGSFARVGTRGALPFRQQLGAPVQQQVTGPGVPVAPNVMLGPNVTEPLTDPDEIIKRFGQQPLR